MYSLEHKNYLDKIKINKLLVSFFQIFIVLFFILKTNVIYEHPKKELKEENEESKEEKVEVSKKQVKRNKKKK